LKDFPANNDYITIEKIKSPKEWNDNFISVKNFYAYNYIIKIFIVEIDGKMMIDSNILKEPIPYGEIRYHDDEYWYHSENELYLFGVQSDKIAYKIKKRENEKVCFASDANCGIYKYLRSIYPIEYIEVPRRDEGIIIHENKYIVSLYKHDFTSLVSNKNKDISILFNENILYFFYRSIGGTSPQQKIDIVKYKDSFEKITNARIVSRNIIIVVTETKFDILRVSSEFNGNSITVISSISFNKNENEINKKWIQQLRQNINNNYYEKKFDVPYFYTGKDLITANIIHGPLDSAIIYSNNSQASGNGVVRQINELINEYILKEVFIHQNIWSKVNHTSIENNELLNVVLYLILNLSTKQIMSFRIPVQILEYISKLFGSENDSLSLEYFFKIEHPDNYAKWLDNPKAELYGHDSVLEVYQDNLYYSDDVAIYLVKHHMFILHYIEKFAIKCNGIPNLATFDWFYSDEISLTLSKNSFTDELIMNFHIDRIKTIIQKFSDKQFENFLFNISGCTRYNSMLKYKIEFSNKYNIYFSACTCCCSIPKIMFDKDDETIIGALTTRDISVNDIIAEGNVTRRNSSAEFIPEIAGTPIRSRSNSIGGQYPIGTPNISNPASPITSRRGSLTEDDVLTPIIDCNRPIGTSRFRGSYVRSYM